MIEFGNHKGAETLPAMQIDQKRINPRNRTLRGGTIVFHNGVFTVKCRIRDESVTGFQLLLEQDQGVPDEFDLVIDFVSGRIPCKVRWRKPGRIGVLRTQEPAKVHAPPPAPSGQMERASLLAEALRLKAEALQVSLGEAEPRKSRLLKKPLA